MGGGVAPVDIDSSSYLELIASNPACPSDLLAQWARQGHELLRRAVASNPSCDSRLLALLSGDNDQPTAVSAVEHPHCPAEVVAECSAHGDAAMRAAAALHRPLDPVMASLLAEDALAFVAEHAGRGHGTLAGRCRWAVSGCGGARRVSVCSSRATSAGRRRPRNPVGAAVRP